MEDVLDEKNYFGVADYVVCFRPFLQLFKKGGF